MGNNLPTINKLLFSPAQVKVLVTVNGAYDRRLVVDLAGTTVDYSSR